MARESPRGGGAGREGEKGAGWAGKLEVEGLPSAARPAGRDLREPEPHSPPRPRGPHQREDAPSPAGSTGPPPPALVSQRI